MSKQMMIEINQALAAQSTEGETITKTEMHEYVDALNFQVWYKPENGLCRKDAITSKGNQRRLYFVPGRTGSVTVEIMRSRVVATKVVNGQVVGRKVARI